MLVSVIVPVYNSEDTLKRLYASLNYQNYKELEIIFVDNNSTDHSYEILLELQKQDRRIKVLKEEKQGVSHARKTGFHASTGEYVYFIDSDDLLSKDGIYQMVLYAKLYRADIVEGSYTLHGMISSLDDVSHIEMIYDLEPPLWIHLYRRNLIHDECFVDLEQFEDYLFQWYVFFHAKNPIRIPDVVYHYEPGEHGLSSFEHMVDPYRLLDEIGKAIRYVSRIEKLEEHEGILVYMMNAYYQFLESDLQMLVDGGKDEVKLVLEEVKKIRKMIFQSEQMNRKTIKKDGKKRC